jgi:signal transduction histidine kinase
VTVWDAPLSRWQLREGPLFAALPYLLLAVSVALSVSVRAGWNAELEGDFALAAAALAWQLALVGPFVPWRRDPRVRVVFYAGLLVLLTLLVIRAPWFGFFGFSGYLYVRLLPDLRWVAAGIVATGAMMALSQLGGPPAVLSEWAVYVLIVAVNVGVAGVMTWFAVASEEQSRRRRESVDELTRANRQLEEALAENAGLHRQLVAQAREAGVLDERQRLAREIHDTLAQGLAGIVTQLQAAEQAGGGSADWRRHVATARELARESLSEARRSVHAIRPEPLEGARLPEAIGDVTRRWSAQHGVPADVTTTGEVQPLRPEIEVTLLRTAQEALANVAKHAGASRVGLTLSYMGDLVTLDVRDDGAGFEPAGAPPERNGDGGFGLAAMRQRVHRVAGTLAVESEPGAGTAVSACVPALPPRADG